MATTEMCRVIDRLNDENYNSWTYRMQLLLKKEAVWNIVMEPKPEVTEKESKATVKEPKATKQESKATKQEPEATEEEQEATKQEPETTAEEQEAAKQELEATEEEILETAWKNSDAKAQYLIVQGIEEKQLVFVKYCRTSKEIWDTLKKHHLKVSLGSQIRIMRNLFNTQYYHEESLSEHLNKMIRWLDQLVEIGTPFTEQQSVAIILSSVSTEYDHLTTALDAWEPEKRTLHAVKEKLLDEYEKRLAGRAIEEVEVSYNVDWKKWKYDERQMELRNDLRYKLRDKAQESKEEYKDNGDLVKVARFSNWYEKSFNVRASKENWCIDSGATSHMCGKRENFLQIDLDHRSFITVASGERIQAKGKGTVRLLIYTDNTEMVIQLRDTLFVPDLNENLISVSKLTERNKTVEFVAEKCFVKEESELHCVATKQNGLYMLNGRCKSVSDVNTEEKEDYNVHVWHQRLSNRKLADVRAMKSEVTKTDIQCCELIVVMNQEMNEETVDEQEEFYNAKDIDSDEEENKNNNNSQEEQEEQRAEQQRRLQRSRAGIQPAQFRDYVTTAEENELIEPKTHEQTINSKDSLYWINAMKEELEAIHKNGTWKVTDLSSGRVSIRSKWVFKVKIGAKTVTRSCLKWFGVDYNEVFDLVVRRNTSFRLLLSIGGQRKIQVNDHDVETSFLNGKTLKEEILMKQSTNLEQENKILKLRKSLYDLKQATCMWNQMLHKVLIDNKWKQSQSDQCIYVLKQAEGVTHVDQSKVTTNDELFMEKTMKIIGKYFELKNLGRVRCYLDVDVIEENEKFFISQSSCIFKLTKEAELERQRNSELERMYGKTKASKFVNYFGRKGILLSSNDQYQKFIGMVLYLTTNARSDIAASVSTLSKRVKNPRSKDLNEVVRLIRYLRKTIDLKQELNDMKTVKDLHAYPDANWAEERKDRKSNNVNSSYYCTVNGRVIIWSLCKQDVVSPSSAEAEAAEAENVAAFTETCKEVISLMEVMKNLGIDVLQPYVSTDVNTADMMTRPKGPLEMEASQINSRRRNGKQSSV